MRGLPRAPFLALLAFAVAVPGCITPGTPSPTLPPAAGAFLDPIVDDHDHTDFAAHNLSTTTMEQIGFTPLGEDGKPFSYVGEIDTFGDLVVLQILGRGSTPGFVLINVSDPTAPAVVGRAEMPVSYVVDVKFDPEGKRVYAASQAAPVGAPDPGAGELNLARVGIAIWDVSDPTAPRLESVTPVPPDGCHMLSVRQIAGSTWVFCVGVVIEVFEVVAAPDGAVRLFPASRFAPQSTTGTQPYLEEGSITGAMPHDMTFQEDPLDGNPLLFVSYWDLGLRVVDVADPRRPIELGAWAGDGATRYEGNVHSAMATLIGGKRYVVATPELLGNTVPAVHVLEATDYAGLRLAAEWIPPGEHGAQSLKLTTHQFQLVGERMYLAYNHAGVWVLDLARILSGSYVDDASRPEVLGYYLPHESVELFNPEIAAVPNTWDVNLRNGYIYASDRYTGFYVLRYKPDRLGDEAITSFA